MVYGDYGNTEGCTIADRVYIKSSHPQYDKIYANIMLAFASEKKLKFYVVGCEGISWYAVLSTTFNIMDSTASMQISN